MDYGKLYDQQVAETYDRDEYALLAGGRALAVAQIEASALPGAATVLDLGGGTGESLVALGARFAAGRFVAVDLSERMLAIARRKVPVETHVDDVRNAAAYVAPHSVDLVLAHFVTSFIGPRALGDIARQTLRPGGVLSIVSTTREAMAAIRNKLTAVIGTDLIDSAAPAPASGGAIADDLRACGFTVTHIDTFRRRLVFPTLDACVQWGLESGFLTQAVSVLGMDRVEALRDVPGLFPIDDEYVAAAVTAVAPPERG